MDNIDNTLSSQQTIQYRLLLNIKLDSNNWTAAVFILTMQNTENDTIMGVSQISPTTG